MGDKTSMDSYWNLHLAISNSNFCLSLWAWPEDCLVISCNMGTGISLVCLSNVLDSRHAQWSGMLMWTCLNFTVYLAGHKYNAQNWTVLKGWLVQLLFSHDFYYTWGFTYLLAVNSHATEAFIYLLAIHSWSTGNPHHISRKLSYG